MAKWMGGLLGLGVLGGCVGLLDEPASPPSMNSTTSSSVSIVKPIVLPWTSVAGTSSSVSSVVTTAVVRPAAGGEESGPTDEIDCEQAEELADSGDYEAGDMADYCDYGPDPGELPDEFDWDE